MMIESKIYKGIEYIQLNELPQTQRDKLTETINKDLFIKIMIDGKIIGECLQFKDYAFWFNSVFKPRPTCAQEPVKVATPTFDTKQLVFKN
jgi:hypothetical protein